MKLLLDEMLSARIAEGLRRRGHDVTAVDEQPDLRGLPDPSLFEVAQREARAIVTYNRATSSHSTGYSGRRDVTTTASSSSTRDAFRKELLPSERSSRRSRCCSALERHTRASCTGSR